MNEFPDELLPSNMFSMKVAPVLWIGAGLSRRFVKGYLSWDELLKEVASKFGVSEGQYVSKRMLVRKKLGVDATEDEISSALASLLSIELIKMFDNGQLNPEEFFDKAHYDQFLHEVDPIKLLVCSSMKDIEFKEEMKEEIEVFKKLAYSIPAIITTNYDTVIETLFDNKFKTYNTFDEYYHSTELGIGEIHKIHGTIRMPRSIVLNEEDYELFKKRSAVVSSKIISLMCESPLLIIGYSLSDWIVRHVIENMLSSFSREKAAEICQNIIYVQYSTDMTAHQGSMLLKHSGGEINIRTIVTNDFLPIFRDIASYEQRIPVSKMRMLRKMFMNVTSIATPEDQRRLALFGIEGIDDVDPIRSIVALTTEQALGVAKSAFKTYDLDDIVKDVLYDMRIPANGLIDIWFEDDRRPDSTFIPIFDYLIKLNRGENLSTKMISYIEKKSNQFKSHFIKLKKEHPNMTNYDTFMIRMNDSERKYSRPKLIAYAHHLDIIDIKEAKELLKAQYEFQISEKGETDTNLRMAVTYLGYKLYRK